MKKSFRMLGVIALAVLALAGCKKNEQTGTMTFKASISQLNSNAKTHIGAGNWLVWNEGDQIKVYNAEKTEASTFTIGTGAGTTDATFSGTLAESAHYYAIYPTTGVELTAESVIKFPLSGTQTFVEGNFATDFYPMYDISDDGNFSFHSPCGILALQLKGTATIGSIVLTDSLGMDLAGTFELAGADLNFPDTHSGVGILMDFGTDGLTLNETTATLVYFVVPAGAFAGGFKADVRGIDGNLITRLETNRPNLIFAETIHLMPEVTGVNAPAPQGTVKGLYSVSPTLQVYFSMGNLQYQRSTDTWRFAENQWDFIGGTNTNDNTTAGNVTGSTNNSFNDATYDGWIDLYGWGTGNNPTNASHDDADYGTFNDWGANTISNGGTNATPWRTLAGGDQEGYGAELYGDGTYGEWNYLLYVRNASTVNGVANARFAKATVNGVPGLIIFADVYTHPSDVDQPASINTSNSSFDDNDYDATEWGKITDAGAAFLPVTCMRSWWAPYGVMYTLFHWEVYTDPRGYYWASYGKAGMSPGPTDMMFGADPTNAYYNTVSAVDNANNQRGFAVRLVRNYEGSGGGGTGGSNPSGGTNGMNDGGTFGW